MLYGRHGRHDNFAAWAGAEPELLSVFRRGVAVASSWLHARGVQRYQLYPWRLATLADATVTRAARLQVAEDFMAAGPERLDRLFSGRLREDLRSQAASASDLLSGR